MRARIAAHPVFTGLFLAGLVLRVVTFFAYRPALIYFDSTRYLDRVHDLEPSPLRPIGYPAFLKLLPTDWELAVVPGGPAHVRAPDRAAPLHRCSSGSACRRPGARWPRRPCCSTATS